MNNVQAMHVNRSERDLKPRKNSECPTGFEPTDTGAMLHQLSYEASPEAGQVRVCDCLSYVTTVKISFTSILYPQFTHDLSQTC